MIFSNYKKNISFYGLFLVSFFLIQNNFLLTNKLAVDLGLGVGSFRAKLLIIFILIGLILLFFKSLFEKEFFKQSINKYSLYIYIFILLIFFIRIIIDILLYNNIDFIGISPIVECLSYILFFNFFTEKKIYISKTILNTLFFIIFLNTFLEIYFYFKDTLTGVQYGPFRTNIAGFTINRNPSFFYPIFCLTIIRFASLNTIIKTIYSIIFSILVLTLFYRTLYIALLFPLILDWLIFNPKFQFKRLLKIFFSFILILFFLIIFDNHFKANYNFSFIEIFTGRFNTTFTSNDFEATTARDQRIDQIPEMLFAVIKNPFGLGFNGLLADGEIYNYAYYFFHPILYIGWSIFIVYFYLFYLLYKNFNKNSLYFRILFHFITYFSIILILFPYMTYFTFTSIFLLSFQLLNRKIIITQ